MLQRNFSVKSVKFSFKTWIAAFLMIMLTTCIITSAKAHGGEGGGRGHEGGSKGGSDHGRSERENRGFSEITGPKMDADQEIDDEGVRIRRIRPQE